MIDQKTQAYYKKQIEPTEKERLEEASLAGNKMLKHFALRRRRTKETIHDLHHYLRIAMMLELSTLPPYLSALYSIEKGDVNAPGYAEEFGDNAEAGALIRSVMMEEMLHFTLAGNVLNAVAGEMKINDAEYVPEYPTALPDSAGNFLVHISKFTKDTIRTFMRIEQPTPADTPPETSGYQTIGQFYHGVVRLMERLEKEAKAKGKTIFTGDTALQIDPNHYYGGGGEIMKVTNLKQAKAAINVILEQGEGSEDSIYDTDEELFDQIDELAHFFKFNEIYEEQRYADCQTDPKDPPQGTKMNIKYDRVYNMGIDPKTDDFVSEELKQMSREFNLMYRILLDDLQAAFTGNQERFTGAVAEMYKMRYLAVELMRNPIPGKRVNAGPTFEFLTDKDIGKFGLKAKKKAMEEAKSQGAAHSTKPVPSKGPKKMPGAAKGKIKAKLKKPK